MKIFVKVITNAKKDEIVPTGKETFKIKVTDLPVEDKANKKLIKLISSYYSVSKSKVFLLQGKKSSNKILTLLSL